MQLRERNRGFSPMIGLTPLIARFNKFPPFPAEMVENSITLTVPVGYNLP